RHAPPFHLIAERTHRSFAEYLSRHALPKLALRAAIGNQRALRMRKHVDETGRNRESRCVDDRRRGRGFEIADRGNSVAFDANIDAPRRGSGAVIDSSAPDDDIE